MTPVKPRAEPVECWACGRLAPRRVGVERFGWHVRPVVIDGAKMREAHCGGCFARWGWIEPKGAS